MTSKRKWVVVTENLVPSDEGVFVFQDIVGKTHKRLWSLDKYSNFRDFTDMSGGSLLAYAWFNDVCWQQPK